MKNKYGLIAKENCFQDLIEFVENAGISINDSIEETRFVQILADDFQKQAVEDSNLIQKITLLDNLEGHW